MFTDMWADVKEINKGRCCTTGLTVPGRPKGSEEGYFQIPESRCIERNHGFSAKSNQDTETP